MERLKLIALDKEDLGILSTYCQDAVAKIGDLQYLPAQRRFVVVMNRYVWEVDGKNRTPERRRSVLHFNQIDSVKIASIDQQKRDEVLSLLAVTFEPEELPAGKLHLVFSGGATIRMEVECIEVQLSDMDAAWKAKSQPAHDMD
ncbi:MAG: DUF2948 family protein [Hyphomicrobiales bacterium]|nr:DUF2948 family protein [Hyphomicrobiales bacterium]